MTKIIPGYFIPIYQEIFYSKRKYSIDILSEISLIPKEILKRSIFFKTKEEFLENWEDNMSDIYIYFDYKYCIISLNKNYYKRLCLEKESCIKDIDFKKQNNSIINICISLENNETFINKKWHFNQKCDYLFINIGIQYLQNKNKDLTKLETNLKHLVIDNYEELIDIKTNKEITGIILAYKDNIHFNNWYRTYKDYANYKEVFQLAISEKDY